MTTAWVRTDQAVLTNTWASNTGTTVDWYSDNFDLVLEDGWNILTEDLNYIALAEFNTTVWAIETDTGNG
jgi:hypothetical protein